MNERDSSLTPSRWGGAALTIAALSLLVTIALYGVVFGAPEPSDPEVGITLGDRARHVAGSWGLVRALWVAEATFFVVMAVAALVLLPARATTGGRLPGSVGWAAVAVGAILQSAMYAFMLGGYPAAIAAVETTPALFQVMRDAALFLFYASNVTLLLGFAAAFAAEGGGAISRRLGWAGGLLFVVAAGIMGAVAAGWLGMIAAAPFAMVAHLLMATLGIALFREGRVARREEGVSAATPRSRVAAGPARG